MSSPMIDLMLTTDRPAATDTGRVVDVGTVVEYRGHVVGGMVRVRFADGAEEIMHPVAFAKLRETGGSR